MISILLGLPFLLISNCSEPTEGTNGVNPFAKPKDWVAMLNELYHDAGIIVEKQNSIQEAVNQAEPGEAIYIEPGTYQESINVNKPVKLIGLSGDNGERVIIKNNITVSGGNNAEIINIQYKNSSSGSRLSTSGGRKASFNVTREELGNKIAHYRFDVKVGSGQFDVVRVHRIVREHKPYQPVRTTGNIFMLHGASLSFESIFLKAGSENINEETSPAFHLASKNIDVWGMDFAWALVPKETTDFTFMKDWGVERDARHALAAMSVARLIRGLTWQGFGRLNTLGYSYGVVVTYAAVGIETQQHVICRDVKGIISVDQVTKYAPEDNDSRTAVCTTAATIKQQLSQGVYNNSNGAFLSALGSAAKTAPDDPYSLPAPLPPGLTNYQAALLVGIAPQNPPPAPFWHFLGGELNGFIPTNVRYSDPSRFINLLSTLPPYQPTRTAYEARACACNEEDVSIDDHLNKIAVPIFYIGAEGAFGELGYYTAQQTSSTDITNINIKEEGIHRAMNYGHADLFLANDAPAKVWEPLRMWLAGHN